MNLHAEYLGGGDRIAFSKRDAAALFVIVALCGILSYLRWTKMETLVWGDTARWLFEAQRVAAGQMPYRDFAWQYPPFSVLALGWCMKWFGVRFAVAQTFVDVVSMSFVLLAYFLVRRVFPRFLGLPVMIWLVAVCGTSLAFFNVFSFATYVPALQTAACGLLALLLGILDYVCSGKMSTATWLLMAVGAFLAAYSKPETFAATYALLIVLAFLDRCCWFAEKDFKAWLRHYLLVMLACVLPTLIGYLWLGSAVGFTNMMAGIGGYGLASATCPWWPTGLGLFGAASALGQAAFFVAALSLTRHRYFVARFGRNYFFALSGGVIGGLIYGTYVFYNNWDLLTGSRSLKEKIWYSGASTYWTSAILLPVMWVCVALWGYLAVRMFLTERHRKISPDELRLILLLTGPVVMSARGWFNWLLDNRTEVPGICYPFFLLLGPYLIWRALAWSDSEPDLQTSSLVRPGVAVVSLLLAYSALRFAAAFPEMLSSTRYGRVSTLAGDVRLINSGTDSEIYKFVMENTSSADTVLDLPYGGGMNFATHRLSPLFQLQFQQVIIPERFLRKDLAAMREHPPKVVIANAAPNYDAVSGWISNTCPFPHLVWVPAKDQRQEPAIPVIPFVEQNYRVAKVVGRKLLLVPK
jgi:hypothetical protein